MTFAFQRKLRADNPAKGVKKPRGRKLARFLNEDEMSRLGEALAWKKAASGSPSVAVRLLALTGCRKDEIAKLKWSYIDFESLLDSKTREGGFSRRTGGCSPNRAAIVGLKEGKPFRGLGRVWERIRRRAGLKDVRLHDLRHSFAATGVEDILSLPTVGALLGRHDPALRSSGGASAAGGK